MTDLEYLEYKTNLELAVSRGIVPARHFTIPKHVLEHPAINSYMNDDVRFKLCVGARQSFKSEIAKRHIFQYAISNNNKRILIGMPVYSQIKQNYWSGQNNIIDFFPKWSLKKKSESDMILTLANGTVIQLFSGDTSERVEGGSADFILLDESADMDLERVFTKTCMPMIAPVHGNCWMIGVPRQSNDFYYKTLYNRYKDNKYDEWRTYTWKAEDILDRSEIEMAKAMVDPQTFTQEYEGIFSDNISGRAYYRYKDSLHINNSLELNDALPLSIAMDFNTKIMDWLIVQSFADSFTYVADVVTDNNTNVYQIVPKLKEKLKQICGSEEKAKSRRLYISGDYTAQNKTVSSRGSTYDEIKTLLAGYNFELKIKPNPEIGVRVAATNARLQSADDKVHVGINEKCSALITDFRQLNVDDLKKNKEKAERANLTHCSDAFSYHINYFYPMRTTGMYNA